MPRRDQGQIRIPEDVLKRARLVKTPPEQALGTETRVEHHPAMNLRRLGLRFIVVVLAGWCVALAGNPPSSLNELRHASPEQLASYDIALVNLLCAEELPGAEGMDVKTCLSTLDQWAEEVRLQTARNLYRYRQNPAKFSNLEGLYRMKIMNAVLMQDLHVGYDLAIDSRAESCLPAKVFFANSKPLFIHGLLTGKHLGTCASLPVLYVALGRRLGYPLKLVGAKSHLFVRWEGLDGRFNAECTAPGLPVHDDDHYKTWPRPMTEAELKSGHYLKSMTATEEFASFLITRGNCLQVNGRLEEAHAAYQHAHELVPASPLYTRFANARVQPTPINP